MNHGFQITVFFSWHSICLTDFIFLLVLCSVMAVPATVIYFTCYDQLFSLLRVRMGDYADMAPALAGALARGERTVRVTNN